MARKPEPEFLDTCSPEEAARNLADLARINRWFGGNRILAALLRPHLRKNPRASVLDVGAADGATIRNLETEFPQARFVALDRSERHLRSGRGVRILADVGQWPVREASVDIVICSLFLHHFQDDEVSRIWERFRFSAREAVIAVDLQRHGIARRFLSWTRPILGWDAITVHDGEVSVDASFEPRQLRALLPHARVRAHPPWFRLSAEWRRSEPDYSTVIAPSR